MKSFSGLFDRHLVFPKLLYFTLNTVCYSTYTFSPLYFEKIWGLDSSIYGFILALCTLSFSGSLIWAVIADKTNRHKDILLITTFGHVATFCFLRTNLAVNCSEQYRLTFVASCYLLSSFFTSAFFPLLDNRVFATLSKDPRFSKELFGRQRLFGTLGQSFVQLATGKAIDVFGFDAMFCSLACSATFFMLLISKDGCGGEGGFAVCRNEGGIAVCKDKVKGGIVVYRNEGGIAVCKDESGIAADRGENGFVTKEPLELLESSKKSSESLERLDPIEQQTPIERKILPEQIPIEQQTPIERQTLPEQIPTEQQTPIGRQILPEQIPIEQQTPIERQTLPEQIPMEQQTPIELQILTKQILPEQTLVELTLASPWHLLLTFQFPFFLLIILIASTTRGVAGNFLPQYYSSVLKLSPWELSLVMQTRLGTEIVAFFFSKQIIMHIGVYWMLFIAQVSGFIRVLAYSIIPTTYPWTLTPLLIELLKGINNAFLTSAGVSFVHDFAPIGAEATAQGCFSGVHSYLANASSGLFGWWILNYHKGDSKAYQFLFGYASILSATGIILYIIKNTCTVSKSRKILC